MSNFVVVDASVWVARLIEQDVFHNLSRRWLDEQRSRRVEFVSPALLLVEVAAPLPQTC